MESVGIAGSKWNVFIKGVKNLLGAFVGLAESWYRGIPACEVPAEQTSPLQNQIPFLAPWILQRGEVREAQGDLALHGNKVSLLSAALTFALLFPFRGPWGSLRVGYCCCYGFQSSSFLQMCLQKHLYSCFLCLEENCRSMVWWLQNCIKADLDMSPIYGEEPCKHPYL